MSSWARRATGCGLMILSGMFACVSGDFAAGQFLCQPDAAEPCPPGLDCIDGICQEPGSAQAGHGGESLGGGGTGPGGGGDGGQAGHGGHAGAGGQGGAGGAPPTPPSCVGLADDCGPQQATDCCAGVVVTGSTFDRSNDDGAEATVSDYRLDWYEVTVGRFRKFVDANLGTEASPPADGAGAHPLIADSGWSSPWNGGLPADTTALKTSLECQAHFTWTDSPGGNETRPINCVSWQLAFAFCAWDEGRLPTEAEWNHAAAAGDKQRLYPWGNDFDASYAAYQCMGDGSGGCAATDILTVGSLTVGYGEWGHADLAGNMWEWVFDGYVDPYPTPCSDCASLTPHNDRVFRGGGYKSSATSSLRTSTRFYQWPGGQSDDVGFRCARQP